MQLGRQAIFEEGNGDDSDNKGGKIELHTAAIKLAETSKRNDVELALDAAELGAIVVPTKSITLVPISLFLGIPTICIPPNGYCLLLICLLLER